MGKTVLIDRICEKCGSPFMAKEYDVGRGYGKYCSAKCRNVSGGKILHELYDYTGENSPTWKHGNSRSKERHGAWNAVHKAVKSGKLIKPKVCESCKQEKALHGHHEDYSRRLDVNWLCRKCHDELHKTSPLL